MWYGTINHSELSDCLQNDCDWFIYVCLIGYKCYSALANKFHLLVNSLKHYFMFN